MCNQASITRAFEPSWSILKNVIGDNLVSLFGPQHGFASTVQANMLETSDARHVPTGLPIYSLYSETREPREEMLSGIDTLILDLQHSGCRIYTYKATLLSCLKAVQRFGKNLVVLDRPNPLGGISIEGRVLDDNLLSFVGPAAMPMRHGLTMGECARFFNAKIGADLEVVSLENWNPRNLWHELTLPWVLPSPNLPTCDSAYFYPGGVIFEGTNVSEGRGTALPFQFFGAAFIKNSSHLKQRALELGGNNISGIFLRPTEFEPVSDKWRGRTCNGVQVHVVEPKRVTSYKAAIALIRAFWELSDQKFSWLPPPYEYHDDDPPISLFLGSKKAIEEMEHTSFSLDDDFWDAGSADWITKIKPFLLYDRQLHLI